MTSVRHPHELPNSDVIKPAMHVQKKLVVQSSRNIKANPDTHMGDYGGLDLHMLHGDDGKVLKSLKKHVASSI